MALHSVLSFAPASETSRRPEWTWKVGLVLETPELVSEITSALSEGGATVVFELPPSTSSFEVANAVERDRPDILFVEFARASKPAAEWILDVRPGDDTPVIAVHPAADPAEMISALRAGSSEFLSLPIRPAIYDAMERIGLMLEARRTATVERGRIAGVLSAKGGCGATTIAAYLSAALQHRVQSAKQPISGASPNQTRVLVADLDYYSPGGSGAFRLNPRSHAGEAFESVRRLSSHAWREFATPVMPGVDLLASPADPVHHRAGHLSAAPALPEQWRVESLFRFLTRQYSWIFVDLGRHLNPSNWALLQNIEELFVITAPDVLALYQTRSILQTLNNRGFEKSRVRIVLNRNASTPRDFWVESIEQMFEIGVFGVVPNDEATLSKQTGERFEFPADTPFGRAMVKIATRLAESDGTRPQGKA